MTILHYLPPTTEKEPKQKTLEVARLETMAEADEFKKNAIKANRELRKGAWFFGGVRI